MVPASGLYRELLQWKRTWCSSNFSSYLGLLRILTFDPVLLRYRQQSLALMEAYDPRKNVWLKLSDMETPCSGLAACALFGLLYTVGASTQLQYRSERAPCLSPRPSFSRWEAGT